MCDIPCLEDWLFRIPAMAMFLELLIGEGLEVGLPSRPPPTLLPPCQYAPWSNLRCLLNIPLLMFLSPQLPAGHSAPWRLLFSTNKHGESFTKLVGICKNRGPTVILVKDTKGHIFGGFASQSWEVKPQFQGEFGKKKKHIVLCITINVSSSFCTRWFQVLPLLRFSIHASVHLHRL